MLPALTALLLTCSGGCAEKKLPAPKKTAEACAKDSDCVLITKRWKNCCRGCQRPYAVHRGRAAATERWHRINCRSGLWRCPKIKCRAEPGQRVARCKKRRCVTEVTLP
jgi:hypothetical protein